MFLNVATCGTFCEILPSVLDSHLGTSPKTVTPKRTPSAPTTLPLKEETMVEMKSLTLEKLLWPNPHDSSTRNTTSACATVLHAGGGQKRVFINNRVHNEQRRQLQSIKIRLISRPKKENP